MGSARFTVVGFGRNANEAFNNAKEEAFYEFGHRGYTGTIAEKPSFILVSVPQGIDIKTAKQWIEYGLSPNSPPTCFYVPPFIEVPEEHRSWVQRWQKLYKNKWGDALCIKFDSTEQGNQWIEESGCDASGPKDQQAYLFFGLASE